MQDAIAPALAEWESFYIIVGSSGGALTGLQFVVMALIADSRRERSTTEIDAFGTPNVVHFCATLLVSALLSAPWRDLAHVALILGLIGVAGIGYAGIVARRARRTGYRPVLEDWIWHVVLPFASYVTLLVAAASLTRHTVGSMFAIAAASLLLLFIGIHNAWDTVTYIVVDAPAQPQAAPEPPTRRQK